MVRPSQKDAPQEITPKSFPETPPRFQQHGHDFTLQAVMEMQKSLGDLSSKTDRLIADSKSQGEKLDSVRMTMHWVAGGAAMLVFLLGIGAFYVKNYAPNSSISAAPPAPPPKISN
jgi:hypothetical protein